MSQIMSPVVGPQNKMDVAAKQLASSLMSQMVGTMFKTLDLPHEQEMFMSFMADAVGDSIADSGLADDVAKSIKGQMILAQEGQKSDVTYGAATQSYRGARLND